MENERLKTSMLVLNQRMNAQDDYEEEISLLKLKNLDLEKLVSTFK